MKKLGILLLTFLFVLSVIQGQQQKSGQAQPKEVKKERVALRKLEGNAVSQAAKNSFNADIGNLPNVQWRRIETLDEASFNKDGKEMKAFYDSFGTLVGTTTHVTFADVPVKGQQEIKARYKDYSIGPVVYFDDNEFNESDMMLYGAQFEDEDNYFVELARGANKIVLQVNPRGEVFFFKQL